MVEAVPMTAQVPAVTERRPSTVSISSESTEPARYFAQKPRQSVQAPSRWPLWRPVDIGPVTTWIAGSPAEAAPMSWAGTVLSQPPISTTASIGWAPIISSVSMAMRLRYIMLVGLRNTSPSEMVGNGARQGAGGQHAARDRLDQLGHVAVAVVEAGRRHGDADHRLVRAARGDRPIERANERRRKRAKSRSP